MDLFAGAPLDPSSDLHDLVSNFFDPEDDAPWGQPGDDTSHNYSHSQPLHTQYANDDDDHHDFLRDDENVDVFLNERDTATTVVDDVQASDSTHHLEEDNDASEDKLIPNHDHNLVLPGNHNQQQHPPSPFCSAVYPARPVVPSFQYPYHPTSGRDIHFIPNPGTPSNTKRSNPPTLHSQKPPHSVKYQRPAIPRLCSNNNLAFSETSAGTAVTTAAATRALTPANSFNPSSPQQPPSIPGVSSRNEDLPRRPRIRKAILKNAPSTAAAPSGACKRVAIPPQGTCKVTLNDRHKSKQPQSPHTGHHPMEPQDELSIPSSAMSVHPPDYSTSVGKETAPVKLQGEARSQDRASLPYSVVPATPIDMPPQAAASSTHYWNAPNRLNGIRARVGQNCLSRRHGMTDCSVVSPVPVTSHETTRLSSSPGHSMSCAVSFLSRSIGSSETCEQQTTVADASQVHLEPRAPAELTVPSDGTLAEKHNSFPTAIKNFPLCVDVIAGKDCGTFRNNLSNSRPSSVGSIGENSEQISFDGGRGEVGRMLDSAENPVMFEICPPPSLQHNFDMSTRSADENRGAAHDVAQPGPERDVTAPKQVLSHTKLCRDRLNSMFDRLRETLPRPPPGVDIKHKAQILDYTCTVLREMVERTAKLEAELALSSARATSDWVARIIQESPSFISAASKVMSLFCLQQDWTFAELWLPAARFGNGLITSDAKTSLLDSFRDKGDVPTNQLHYSFPIGSVPVLQLGTCLFRDSRLLSSDVSLGAFVAAAQAHNYSPGDGIVGRVWTTGRPVLATGIDNPKVFSRASCASSAGLKTLYALPVTVNESVGAVLVFYDKKEREQDTNSVEIGMRLIWSFANALAAKCAN